MHSAMGITHLEGNNHQWWHPHNHQWWNPSVQSSLIDIFSQTIDHHNSSFGSSKSLEELYTWALQKIIAYGEWDIVTPLKKTLWKNKKDTLKYIEINDITLSLYDIIDAFQKVIVKNKLPIQHDTAIAKAFLSRIETTIQWFPKEVTDIFKTEIIDNAQYIYSLEYLWKWLTKFYDVCKKAWHELTPDNLDAIRSTSITFLDIEHQLSKTDPALKADIIQSHKDWSIPVTSEQEKLLNTHMTLYGVSKIQKIFDKYKGVENRLRGAYDFWWIDDLWKWLWVDDTMLSDIYPVLKVILEDETLSDVDIFTAKMKYAGEYLSTKNNPLWSVLTKLSQNNMDFSLLSQEDQNIYLDTYKKHWIDSSRWSDLIDYFDSFWVKKDQALRLVDWFFSPTKTKITVRSSQGDKINVTIDKKIFTWKSLSENCHLLQTQWLPFSFSLTGESLDQKQLAKIHTKKDWFYADKIPHALTLIVWAKAIANMSDEELDRNSRELQGKINQHTFAPENMGLQNTALSSWIEDRDEIDWNDSDAIQKFTADDLHNIQWYTKDIVDTKQELWKCKAKENTITDKLNTLNNSIYTNINTTPEQKAAWEKERDLLETQREENQARIDDLQEKKTDLEQKRKYAESLFAAQKKKGTPEQENPEWDIVVPKKEAAESIDYFKEAQAKWDGLQWDKNAPFAVWSSICMDIPDIQWPLLWWKHPWARWEIVSIDEDGNFELKMTWIDQPLQWKNQDWHAIEWSIIKFYGASGLDEFGWKVWKMWKFGKQTSWKDFWLQLKDKWLNVDKEYKDYLDNFLNKVDFWSMYRREWSVTRETEDNKIRYLWWNIDDLIPWEKDSSTKEVKTQKVWYEIKQLEDWVVVTWKDRDWNKYDKKMNPQEFMVFLMDKSLTTYTQAEVDTINTERAWLSLWTLESEIDRSQDVPARKKRLWTNLQSIWHAFKFWFDGVKKWLKDKQGKDDKKLEKAMLGSKWFQSLSKLPLIWDAFEDMYIWHDKAEDQEKTKEIKEAMEEPEKNWEDTTDWPYQYILNDKFKKVADWWVLSDEKDVRKFAWYFCYVLSKKSDYPRLLAPYAGTGVWVRWILGAKYQEQYIQYINQLKHNVEQNPNDSQSKNLLSQRESWFMKKVYNDGDADLKKRFNWIFGKVFFTKTLGEYDSGLFDLWTVEEIAKKAKAKLFNAAKWDYDSAFKQQRMLDMYGTLKWMGENIKSDPLYYREWMMRLALPILSWITVNSMDEWIRWDYATLARQYASPFWLYAKDADGQRKLWELFGIVSKQSSVWSDFTHVFAEFMPTATENRPTEKQFPDFLAKLNTRWFENGNKMLELLEQPWKLISIKSTLEEEYKNTPDSSPRKQEIMNQIMALRHYIDKKWLDDSQWEVEIKLWWIVAERNIINLSPWAISKIHNYKSWSFQKELVEDWPKAWKALTKQIKWYNPPVWERASPDLYQFVLKKFIMFMKPRADFSSTNLQQLLVALKYSNINTIPSSMDIYLMDVIDKDGQTLPKEVKDTVITFKDFLKNQQPNNDDLKKILDAVIEKGAWDLYESISTWSIKKSWKKEVDDRKKEFELMMNKKDWKNVVLVPNEETLNIFKDSNWLYRDKLTNILTIREWWKKKWQQNTEVVFDRTDAKWNPIDSVKCPYFVPSEIQAWSYERDVLKQDNGGGYYNNPYEWFGWFND
jgi:hypothetical protein